MGVKPYFWQGQYLEVPFFPVKSLASLPQERKRGGSYFERDNIFVFLTKSFVSPPIKDEPEFCDSLPVLPKDVSALALNDRLHLGLYNISIETKEH